MMKKVKWRKSNPYFKSLEAEQQRRLSKCGWDAKIMFDYQISTWHRTFASVYSDRNQKCLIPLDIRIKGEQRV